MMKKLFPLLFILLLAACQAPVAPAPAQTTAISKDKALELGTQSCNQAPLRMQGPPTKSQVTLLTYKEASAQLPPVPEGQQPVPAGKMVWLVQLQGVFLLSGPSQGGPVTPAVLTTCHVIIDAETGEMLNIAG